MTLNPAIDYTLFTQAIELHDTNRVEKMDVDVGGKGINLSRIVCEMEGDTLACGFVGGKPRHFIESRLDYEKVPFEFTRIKGTTRTNVAVQTLDETPPTTFNASGPAVTFDEWDALVAILNQHMVRSQWVCLCGSVPQSLPREAFFTLGQAARAAGKQVLLDADGVVFEAGVKCKPHLIKPNRDEAQRFLGQKIETESDEIAAVAHLCQFAETAILSLGARGALYSDGKQVLRGITPKVTPCSTIGSGDSLLGGFLASISRGDPAATAFRWGLACGAATAMTDGSKIGQRQEILRLFDDARVEIL